jgi:hypothetical protein
VMLAILQANDEVAFRAGTFSFGIGERDYVPNELRLDCGNAYIDAELEFKAGIFQEPCSIYGHCE